MIKSINILIKAEENFLSSNGWQKIISNKQNLWTPINKSHFCYGDKLSRSNALEIVKDTVNFPQF